MKKFFVFFVCGLFLCWGTTASAGSGFALGLKVGTLGIGAEGTIGLTDSLNTRIGFNAYPFSYSGTVDDVDYNFDLSLLSGGLFLDWHPFGGNFRLSAGGLVNGNKIEAESKPNASYKIGDNTYTADQVGTLKAETSFNNIAPYAGIGFGDAVGKDKRFGFALDLGVIYQGTPSLKYTVTGPIQNNPAFQQDMDKQMQELKDALNYATWYPVVSIGLTYKF
jgi:hypothetical protein